MQPGDVWPLTVPSPALPPQPLHRAADISAAFPSVAKPAAKQRRRSLSDAGDAWVSRVAAAAASAEADEAFAPAAAAGQGGGSSLGNYWSDPLPLPASAQRPATAPEDDTIDTAASPASSDGGCCSPCGGAEGMEGCGCSPAPPSFSPLRELRGAWREMLQGRTLGCCCSRGPLRLPPIRPSAASDAHRLPRPHPARASLPSAAAGALRHALPTVDNPDCGFPAITAKVGSWRQAAGAGRLPRQAGRLARRWGNANALPCCGLLAQSGGRCVHCQHASTGSPPPAPPPTQTMRDLLTHGAAAFGLAGFVVVDCRYDFEHQGGHLPGAPRPREGWPLGEGAASCGQRGVWRAGALAMPQGGTLQALSSCTCLDG